MSTQSPRSGISRRNFVTGALGTGAAVGVGAALPGRLAALLREALARDVIARVADEDLEECMSYYPRGLVLPEAKKPKRVSTKPVPYSARDSYQVGQVVEHKTFGRGEVTRSAGKQVTIRFEEQGTKVLAQKLS